MRLSRWVYAWLMRADEQILLLDLYMPEQATELLPVVVWIHGGAWITGSKADPKALPNV